MDCHALLWGIFPTQDQTYVSYLLHWQLGSLPLVPPGKPTGNQGSERLCNESKVIRQYSSFCFNPYFENVNVFQWNWNSKEQCEHNSHFVFAYKQVHSEEIYSKYRKLHPIFFTPWHRAMLEYTKSTHHKHLHTSYQPTMWDVNHIHSHLVLPLSFRFQSASFHYSQELTILQPLPQGSNVFCNIKYQMYCNIYLLIF